MMGRPKKRIAFGTLPCTLGGHLAPHEDFRRKPDGTIDSWCKSCRVLRDKLVNAKKAVRERNRKRPVLTLRSSHKLSDSVTRSVADNSCARYPQD